MTESKKNKRRAVSISGKSRHERRMEKARLKKEAMQRLAGSAERRGRAKKAGMAVAAVLAVVAIGYVVLVAAGSMGKGPAMELSETEHNFGNVSRAAGVVSARISLRNAGESELVIDRMVTSCMCTSAVLLSAGESSPVFGMHGAASGWQGIVKPGEAAEIEIRYDPNVHPELRGAVTRTVTVYSNDAYFPAKEIRISAYQTA